MNEQAAVQRARAITRELEAMGAYTRRIAAERASLIRDLITAGWSERDIAAELGISQAAVNYAKQPTRRQR